MNNQIIIALDLPDADTANQFVAQLSPTECRLKVGPVLFTRYGPALLAPWIAAGFSVFLDLKFHDIPQTVASACRVAAQLGVWMVNVHASGGVPMLCAAREAIDAVTNAKTLLLGVTALTSLDAADIVAVGVNDPVETWVLRLAGLCATAGLDGVVSSARELPALRAAHPTPFVLLTPGIRLPGDQSHDQKRTLTPGEARRLGADYIVVGRPITESADPLGALVRIQQDFADG
ncbi:MAG: orotidine 5'-phosphate decarboxylase [Gammaproteobacteria bacterium RIFCSPHIGHO2_12_FULL_45_9]|nr:MAG: orotidine 5'-phosphate decarboxylase [Gammaproteobacteria bacterium RIFCSPHIGHO2_12_FULL_45_9]